MLTVSPSLQDLLEGMLTVRGTAAAVTLTDRVLLVTLLPFASSTMQ